MLYFDLLFYWQQITSIELDANTTTSSQSSSSTATNNGSRTAFAELIRNASQSIQDGDFAGAVRLYTEALKLDSTNHIVYGNRSAAYCRLGKYKKALQDAIKARELKPTWSKAYYRQGIALQVRFSHHLVIKCQTFSIHCHDCQWITRNPCLFCSFVRIWDWKEVSTIVVIAINLSTLWSIILFFYVLFLVSLLNLKSNWHVRLIDIDNVVHHSIERISSQSVTPKSGRTCPIHLKLKFSFHFYFYFLYSYFHRPQFIFQIKLPFITHI